LVNEVILIYPSFSLACMSHSIAESVNSFHSLSPLCTQALKNPLGPPYEAFSLKAHGHFITQIDLLRLTVDLVGMLKMSNATTGKSRANDEQRKHNAARPSLNKLMLTADFAKLPHPKANTSRRIFTSSLKAIVHSRHANTRRNPKRALPEPWIGEMIIVKDYDQMDSLREILENPARVNEISTETEEEIDTQSPLNCGEERDISSGDGHELIDATRGVKRKRNEEEEEDSCQYPDEHRLKRQKVTGDSKEQQAKESVILNRETEKVASEKANIEPLAKVLSLFPS
jgi:hypothetical protein